MSVIENAIKMLHAKRAAEAQARDGVFASVRTGTGPARLAEKAFPAAPPARPARVIVIDQVALRSAGLLPPEHQERELAQQYRQIKRPLINKAFGRGVAPIERGNIIMIASAMAGEGKTFISLNLAFSIRLEEDASVLLMDGDVANPRISRLLGVADEKGILDVLQDPSIDVESVILPTDVPGLSLLPAGRRADNATELLASARMTELVTGLAGGSSSRIVLFDSPPLLLTTESHALAQLAGQIVLVVRADQTPQSAVLEAIDKIQEEKSVALILNQSLRAASAGYYYGEGSVSQEGASKA